METAPAPQALRFMSGARERDSGVYYDETRTLSAGSQTLPEAKSPPGDWLRDQVILFDVTTAGNAAAVTFANDGPFNLIDRIRFKDATGTTLHELTGYELFLVNLLNKPVFNSDPRKMPDYSVTTGVGGGAGGSATFSLIVPVEFINRDATGVLPNGASNSVTRTEIVLAGSDTAYGVAPTTAGDVRVRIIERGYVQPVESSLTGPKYASKPPGAPYVFQQCSSYPYDLAAGRKVHQHERKGNNLRSLIFVARGADGERSDTLIDEMRLRIDKVETLDGPWRHLRNVTFSRHSIAAADLPAGVVQASFAHEWDGSFGGEVRDMYIPTMPGSLVEFDIESSAAGELTVITQEIVAPVELGMVL